MQMPPFSTTALSLPVDVSIPFPLRRLESAASYIPNSTKVLIMWLAGKMWHIPCSHWLPEEARWGGELCDETKTAACDTKIKLVCLFKVLSLIYFLA